MGVRCEGVKGAIADFVCFYCPLVASADKLYSMNEQIPKNIQTFL